MPSSSGIFTSSRAMSGFSSRIASSAARPSPALPTTSSCGWSPTARTRPSRTRGGSSATKTDSRPSRRGTRPFNPPRAAPASTDRTPSDRRTSPTPGPSFRWLVAPMRKRHRVADVDSLPDEQLMALVKDGDVRAFDELVRRHYGAVTNIARRTCGADLADDVAQAAFISLWQHSGTYFAERGSVRRWLLAIVRNRGIDLMRSRASRQRLSVPADPHGWMLA